MSGGEIVMCWDAVVQEQGQSVTCTVSMLIELEAAPSDSLSKPWRGHDRPFTGSARLGEDSIAAQSGGVNRCQGRARARSCPPPPPCLGSSALAQALGSRVANLGPFLHLHGLRLAKDRVLGADALI